MNSFDRIKSISSWTVFAIAMVVYYMSAERTGSLWDCGEFILGAYKLQVVHPPGAPFFLLVGRLFTWVAELISSDPANIAFAVNLMSGVCTAFTAFFVARVTMLFGRRMFDSNDSEETVNNSSANLALGGAGLVAGLATAFCSSIWFSAVEGEVYAMSTMFTAVTFWAATKWYVGADNRHIDKWLLLVAYLAGLSIGVHLLSLLTFPAIALMYYFKKYKSPKFIGVILSLIAGAAVIGIIQKIIIVGIPSIWKGFELFAVNSLGLPFHSGIIFTLLLVGVIFFATLKFARKRNAYTLNLFILANLFVCIGFSTIGVVVIRANADTPINMNVPSDAMRLLPYINREQYGERPLVYGPHFEANPVELDREDRYGRVGDKYEVVEESLKYKYKRSDKILFPRIGHNDSGRPALHKQWYSYLNGGDKLKGKPGMGYNLKYMFSYQIGWMYWRYFFWNFAGKQNGSQGYKPWDKTSGHWRSGVGFLDEMKLYNMSEITDTMKKDPATNKYYFIPFILGLIGFFFQFKEKRKDWMILLLMFLVTGIGIIIYSNQPPNEPRERDYVLVGSFFTYCIWIGLSVVSLFKGILTKVPSLPSAGIATALAITAPLLMGFQNFDDHSRNGHYGSRDYASNFLESVKPNGIIFTYGDNDTYPLWYAQEVENIRTDVRVVNLSLIAVDWYINKLRNKVNDSAPLKFSLPASAYRGKKRNQVFFAGNETQPINIFEEFKFIGDDTKKIQGQSVTRSRNYFIPINRQQAIKNGLVSATDSTFTPRIDISFSANKAYYTKDELAVMDILANNINDRPIYFAVTCKNEKLLGLNDYMQLEGLGLRLLPIKNKSDATLSIYGSGRVDVNIASDNIMNKWKWGNFDKFDTHIAGSYGAELQAMKITMMRTSNQLASNGDWERATALSKKFFEAFPHFNFPYDEGVTPFINVLIAGNEKEEAEKHLRILAEETYQKLNFYESLDEEDFQAGFTREYGFAIRAVNEILQTAQRLGKPEVVKEFKDLLGQYDIGRLNN